MGTKTTYAELNPALEFEHITLARILMAQGRLDEAQHLLTRLLAAATSAGRWGRVIAICVLQALCADLYGNTQQALETLEQALTLGEPEGYIRTFLDEGEPLLALLREARRRNIKPKYVAKLLEVSNKSVEVIAQSPHQSTDSEIKPLSEREVEVLQLIVDGASNREIAEQLVISLGTVKKHLNNIFLKLDANSRTQVIAIAHQRRLI